MEKQKYPEVRFKDFNENWSHQTLGDMFIPLSNNTLSRADLNYESGQIKNIHYGDILVKYAAVLDYRNDRIPFITDGKVSDFKSQRLQNGDVIFADTAEDETVGKAIEINIPVDAFIVSGLHTMAYRPNTKLSSFYLGHYLNSNSYHYQLLPLMQGIKVLSISRTNLAKTLVRYPTAEQEQTQIGNFFQNLDQSIALHEKKLTQTQNLKKVMLEKMFPKAGSKQPEIRLKGFIDDWKESKLGDVYSFNYGKFNTNPSNGGQYPVYGANGIIGGYTDYNAENSAVIGHMGEYAGSVLWAEGKHFVTYNGTISKPKKSDFDSFFGYFTLVKMNLKRVCGGSGQPFLSYDVLERLDVLLPTLEEQTVIGQLFKQLDETLALQQQQLKTLKNLKQAFLEKMFV